MNSNMTSAFKNIAIALGLSIFLSVVARIPAHASGTMETSSLGRVAMQFHNLFGSSDLVFLGEYHAIRNHKDVFRTAMSSLVESGRIDTVAVEFIQYSDNDLLKEYLKDPAAVTGSPVESTYFLRFSNCNRKCGSYLSPGGWPMLDDSYINTLRDMRRLAQKYDQVNFCGINTDQNYKNQFVEINSDVAGLATLSQTMKAIGLSAFESESFLAIDNQYGWGSGAVRELRFAQNTLSCLKDSKKALIFVGGFHAMQFSKVAGKTPEVPKWSSAAELVAKVSGKKTLFGVVMTTANKVMEENEVGIFGLKFHSQFKFSEFEIRNTSELPNSFFDATKSHAYNELSLFDYVVLGPRSEFNEFEYKVPNKTLTPYTITSGELQNINLQTQTVEYSPSLNSWEIFGKTLIRFTLVQDGRFAFQFTGNIQKFTLNGREISEKDLIVIQPSSPMQSPIYLYNSPLKSNENHFAEISFALGSGSYTIFEGNQSKLLTFETRFDNRYGIGPQTLFPTLNLPSTQPQLTLHFRNSKSFSLASNTFLSNGVATIAKDKVTLVFEKIPSQQIYFQSRPKVLNDPEFKFPIRQGLDAQLKISHFFLDHEFRRSRGKLQEARVAFERDLIKPLQRVVIETVQKMENAVGPYPHGLNLIINVHPDFDGDSMEYAGALNSGLNSIVHEIIHQWFATSVKPQTNADAWLFESITTWIELTQFDRPKNRFDEFLKTRETDYWSGPKIEIPNYNTAMTDGLVFNRKYCPSPTNLELCEGFSFDWYRVGPSVMDQIDKSLKSGSNGQISLTTILKIFYTKFRGKYAGTNDFIDVLAENDPNTNWLELLKFTKIQK